MENDRIASLSAFCEQLRTVIDISDNWNFGNMWNVRLV
jgi:hypothetical protein